MKFSKSFIKTLKQAPREADSKNAAYLIRAGFIEKQMAGVYALLPLGFRVYKKIENIIREEMNVIGGQEILLNVLQKKELWEETGRWKKIKDIFYQFRDNRGKTMGLGPSHEEQLTSIIRKKVRSYKDLPQYLYQIQAKFRNEPRAKSGLLRGREFLMKDLYSFHADEADFEKYYEKIKKAYFKVFTRFGLPVKLTEASGGIFSEFSHEFQVVNEVGEDTIYFCDDCDFSQNKEIAKVKEGDKCPNCGGKIKTAHAIEVGNIFPLGTKYSKPMKAIFTDEDGKEKNIVMGCYGIGLTRSLATIVEHYFDEKKNVMHWPAEVAPFRMYLISLSSDEEADPSRLGIRAEAEKLYQGLIDEGIEVLYDDRAESAGVKFADADLMGIPLRIVISKKTLEADSVEVKESGRNEVKMVKLANIHNILNAK